MMKQGAWKAIKINLWLTKEELIAMAGMMTAAVIFFVMFDAFLMLGIASITCMGIGLHFMNKALCKIFVENRYGDSSFLIKMLPLEDKSLRRGNYIVAAGAVSGMVFALVLCLLAGYLALHRYDLESVMGFIRWLCCLGSPDMTGGGMWAMVSLEVIYILALGLCVAAVAEYASGAAGDKGESLIGKGNSKFEFPLSVFMMGILLPWLVLLLSDGIPPALFHLGKITIVAVMALLFSKSASSRSKGIRRSTKPEERAKKTKRERAELDLRETTDKGKAYEKLIAGKGVILNWKRMLLLILPICIILRNVEVSDAILVSYSVIGFCLMGEILREWNTSILFDENAAFYYSLPIKTEEVVKAHMKIGFKMMIPAALAAMAILLIRQAQKGFVLPADFVLWVLTIFVLVIAFCGWGLFNSAYASRWRDPLTHKTSRFAGGICLLVEVAIHWAIVMLVLYADGIARTIGSIFLLLASLAECYLVYRLGISELRDMYSA